ncbi:hypothetical protein AAVH_33912, partial [Aphelenchoides avenae]
MSIRPGKFNPLHRAGKLFQEWAVMTFVFMEGDRLNWIRANQHTLRADAYDVQAFLQAAAVEQNANVGQAIILPASFPGSPRFWRQNFEDAMAIMRAHGVPDIFVTMTCNAKWPEITDVIKFTNDDGTEVVPPSTDRPDIIARVFDLKKDALLKEIKKCFGKLVAWIYVIEFQQRGLPHLHLVGTLEDQAKFRTMDDIDRSVLAQIPDQAKDPVLFDLVAKHHVHGPNCAINPRAMCKTPRGFCRWNFPKPYRRSTRVNEDGRVEYARPDNGRAFNVGSVDHPVLVTNRDISSYCPRLLKRFGCHVNVDLCFGSNAIKYLFKYCYKGYDRTKVALSVDGTTLHYDEPAQHVDARCVTAPEAMWRLRGNELHGKSHTVECLDVNLPGQNVLKYDQLASYFSLCAQQDADGELARSLYYDEIPKEFIFRNGKWIRRQIRWKVVSRLASASPRNIERFHLRLLLLHVKGAVSYEDLRTVDGVVCQTFVQACVLRGITTDDSEWDRTLEEAVIWQFPRQLRELFALILVHCLPKEPGILWEKYQDHLAEDYVRDLGPELGTRRAYEDVVLLLESMGMSLADFPDMPELPGNRWSNEVIDIDAEKAEAGRLYALLNPDQRRIVDEVLAQLGVENFLRKQCYYIDGPAGVGKTFTYRELEEASVIILDEAPMLSRFGLEAAERKIRELKRSLEPFGGVIFILGGDHRQCTPIQTGAVKSEILDLCISSSALWKHFNVRTLTQNMRLDADQVDFNAWQLSVGNGDSIHGDEGEIVIPEECRFDGDLASEVYSELFADSIPMADSAEYLRDRCILSVLNEKCKTYNDNITQRMPGQLSVFTSINRMSPYAVDAFAQDVTTETMDAYDPPELPPHKLKLKVGSIIILLRNLDVKRSLCNGTRLLVTRLGTRVIEAVHVMDGMRMKKVWIPRIKLESNGDRLPFKFMRTQFPVKAAFALTINKSQGQTFKRVGLDLTTPVFAHGQAYVGLSRVRNAQSLRVLVPEEEPVTNVVYKEVSYAER